MSAREPSVARDFNRAVIEAFGLVRSFWLCDAGPRAVMIACREAKPRSEAERASLAELHRRANRLAELETPGMPARR
ncbi:hypothetical protein [Methylocystis sp. SC2]|uniref:hypothetical protein n=1 Tax=Methylocystis sp. (strain SC2) TaxID=187303 RepID=UPI00027AF00D|nr:hypothetical protein [Methylocystis sp. SC2]CCJ07053.1 Hypothetical protein BN69_1602 [Methylocystis sp. SC2]